jgi:(E)-4-hydroxy-3-methyl-but-2-enyl pyrophosphate reductase
MKTVLAKSAGFCFGVDRAVSLTERALEDQKPCWSLGQLIHNREAVERLAQKGLHVADCADDIPPDVRVVIRSHGVSRAELEALKKKNCEILDATCPKVARIHEIVAQACAKGRQIVIIGEPSHPEVQGICGWCEGAVVLPDGEALLAWAKCQPDPGNAPVTVVFQTTSNKRKIEQSIKSFKNLYTNAEIFDTICNATVLRQKEAREIAEQCDAMVVVGGLHSANSVHLAEICAERGRKVLFVQNAGELKPGFLCGYKTVGVTAGASTPAWIIKEVVNKMSEESEKLETSVTPADEPAAEEASMAEETPAVNEPVQNPAPIQEGEKTFDQLLEDSIKTISNGDTVTGIVAAITPTEITLDLSTKHSGYIPVSEFTNDVSGVDINTLVHIGDEIKATVVRVNDVEGTAQLSKRRLDAARGWDDIETARQDGTVLEGKVSEDNKGGVVVTISGIRVFVPASQTGLGRDEPMSTLVGKTVRLKITEVNRARKRVVGSIRNVMFRERRERAEKIWSEIEVGKKYEGVVKSLTSYGAFVDIGGVDGMVHVSEISWDRIRTPGDVLHVGDKIEVYVISFDPDKKKISLGYRKPEDNPWNKFVAAYNVGDIAKVKIVKLMPFGAFAEVVPGVDGLIHISQIANRRIGKPDEVLTVGDVVDAKITAVDNEKQKISLSIRALIEPAPAPARKPREDRKPQPESDALVYEVSATGEATGVAPEDDEKSAQ